MSKLSEITRVARLHREARQLCSAGKFGEAKVFADGHGFKLADIPDLTIPANADFSPPPPPPTEAWPKECIAMIWRYCRNKRLVVIHIDDGREAAMWTAGRTYRLGVRLKVKLDDDKADPKYVPVPGGME